MTPIILDRSRRGPGQHHFIRAGASTSKDAPSAAPTAQREMRRGTTFEADLVAQLSVLRLCAHKLTHDRERALDLVQDTCERALRFRHLFREGTKLRARVLIIIRHHFLDMAKRSRNAMVSG